MPDKKSDEIFDLAVIGGGPAGYAAGLYAARFELRTAVFAASPGGLIVKTHLVENYPGLGRTDGFTVGEKIKNHAEDFGVKSFFKKIDRIERGPGGTEACPIFQIFAGEEIFTARAVILATGATPRKLPIPGAKAFENKGVSYCATCDGAFFRGKTVGVVGGGDSAAKEALLLADFCEKVHIFVRKDFLRAEPINGTRVRENPKIEVHFETELAEIFGEETVRGVRTTRDAEIALDGVFFAVGYEPAVGLGAPLGVPISPRGYFEIDPLTGETGVPGVFAAGDATDDPVKQAITAAAGGVRAAIAAYEMLQKCGAPVH